MHNDSLICTYNRGTYYRPDMPTRLTLGKEYSVEYVKGTHNVSLIDDLGELLIVNIVRFNETGKRWTENPQRLTRKHNGRENNR